MTQVIKRGGKRRQAFSPSKIKDAIKHAAKEASFSPSKTEELVKEVGNGVIDFFGKKKVVKAVDIRKSILRRLERRTKTVASKWKSFERKKSGRF
jgi:transcriptional regulator NrdR family protein